MKNLCIYGQRWQSNGYYPVTCFKRVNNEWYQGDCTVNINGKMFFNMRTAYMNNKDVLFILKNNYSVYSKKEIFNTENKMNNSDLSLKYIKELIYK